jgi:hypothetical protein
VDELAGCCQDGEGGLEMHGDRWRSVDGFEVEMIVASRGQDGTDEQDGIRVLLIRGKQEQARTDEPGSLLPSCSTLRSCLTEEGAIVCSILQLPKLTWPMHAVLERRSPRRHRGRDGSTHRLRARPDCDSRRAPWENGAGGSPSQGDSRRDAAVELPEPAWVRLLGWLPMRPRHQSTEARHSVDSRLRSDWGRTWGGGLVPWCFRKLAAGERDSDSGAVVGGSAVGIAAQDAQPSPASVQDGNVYHI